LQGERAAHVRVEHEEPVRAALQDGIAEVVQAAGGAQSLVLAQVGDLELRELARRVLDEVAEDGLLVVADQDDLFDVVDFADGLEAVPDDGVAGDIEEWLHRRKVMSLGQVKVVGE
jgi:hypothetical protein